MVFSQRCPFLSLETDDALTMRRSAGHQLATPLLRMSDPRTLLLPAILPLYAFGAATITKYDGAEQVELKTEILIPTTSTTGFVRRSRRSSTPTRRSRLTAKTRTRHASDAEDSNSGSGEECEECEEPEGAEEDAEDGEA